MDTHYVLRIISETWSYWLQDIHFFHAFSYTLPNCSPDSWYLPSACQHRDGLQLSPCLFEVRIPFLHGVYFTLQCLQNHLFLPSFPIFLFFCSLPPSHFIEARFDPGQRRSYFKCCLPLSTCFLGHLLYKILLRLFLYSNQVFENHAHFFFSVCKF